jgi:pyruvate dehydrogenase E2 component (dihydrolipoamide acetyltransferase)
MAIAVNMPQIGQDIIRGVIREWHVGEGDQVEEGDVLATVESEKAAFEVEAPDTGTLVKILYSEGQEAEVFKPIAYIGLPGEKIPETTDKKLEPGDPEVPEADAENPSTAIAGKRKIFASPAVKRLAREHNISLEKIRGSGPEGRIIKRDLLFYLEGENEQPKNVPGQAGDQVIPFSPARQSIARRLTESKQHIPHFYLSRHINVSGMLAERIKFNEEHPDKVSINDLIVYAVARSLREFPRLNAHVQHQQIILKGNINIGIAVFVEDGLLVPVITDADRKSLEKISRMAKDIIQKAQRGIMQGGSPGSFTVSNLGMYGISEFQAIINPPETAILSIGKAEKRAVQGDQGVELADYMVFGLACDHRVVDGAYGARFLALLAEKLENLKI